MLISLFRVLFMLLISLAFASCGGGGGGGEEEPPEEVVPPVEITPQDQTIRMTSANETINESTLRTTKFRTVNLSTQRLRSRATVNVGAFGEEFGLRAIGYAPFTARAADASLMVDMDWFITMLSAINLSTGTEVEVNLRIREINPNGSLGTEVFFRQLERDGIGSGLKAVEVLNVRDSVNRAYQLSLKEGQLYRAQIELHCSLRVDILSLSLIDCNAESGDRGLNVNELMIMY